MAKVKQLYFSSAAADGTGSTEEIIMVPSNNVSHYEVVSTTELDVWFKQDVIQESNTDAAGVDSSKVRLTVTAGSGNMKSVLKSIANLIADPYGDALVVIYDGENSLTCNSLITGAAITVIDAS
jgi:hypothetical protein